MNLKFQRIKREQERNERKEKRKELIHQKTKTVILD